MSESNSVEIPIEKIIISGNNPRQHFNDDNLRQLGENIKAHGQIQNILVRPKGDDYELIVGERRVRACALVGIPKIRAEVIRSLDDAEVYKMKLIENVHREDLSDAEKGDAIYQLWAFDKYGTIKEVCASLQLSYETVKANWLPKARKLSQKVKELTSGGETGLTSFSDKHSRYLLKYPHAAQNRLAEISVSRNLTSRQLQELTKLYDEDSKTELDQLADKILGIKKIEVPMNMLTEEQKQIIEEAKTKKPRKPRTKPNKPKTKEEIKSSSKPFKFKKVKVKPEPIKPLDNGTIIKDLPDSVVLKQGPFQQVCKELSEDTIDYIITDPPYGKEYLPLYEDLAKEAARLLKEGGSLIVMTGQSYLPEIYALLSKHLNYQWTLTYLTPGGQSAQLWQRKVNTFWKPLLWFVKGQYNGKWIGDVTKSAVNDNQKNHMDWQQSESGMLDIVERFTENGTIIMDPFMGSGTTGIAATKLNRRFYGIEANPQIFEIAKKRLGVNHEC